MRDVMVDIFKFCYIMNDARKPRICQKARFGDVTEQFFAFYYIAGVPRASFLREICAWWCNGVIFLPSLHHGVPSYSGILPERILIGCNSDDFCSPLHQ